MKQPHCIYQHHSGSEKCPNKAKSWGLGRRTLAYWRVILCSYWHKAWIVQPFLWNTVYQTEWSFCIVGEQKDYKRSRKERWEFTRYHNDEHPCHAPTMELWTYQQQIHLFKLSWQQKIIYFMITWFQLPSENWYYTLKLPFAECCGISAISDTTLELGC